MRDKRRTKTQRGSKGTKSPRQITELHPSKAKRTRAEEELVREHNLLRTVVDNLPDRIFVKDTNSTFVFANLGCGRYLGFDDPKAVIGKTTLDFLPPEAAEESRAQEREIMRTGEGVINEEVCRKGASGQMQCYLSTKVPWRDKDGNIIGIIGLNRDITDRKRAVKALQKSESEKKLILDSLSELIIYQDENFRIVWANKAAADSAGQSVDELTGRHCYEIWCQRDEPGPDCPVRKSFETGRPQESEVSTPDGKIWYIRSYPIRNQNGGVAGVVEVTLDITKRREAEKHRQKLTEVLAEKNRELELRTPMVNIEGFSRILTQSCEQIPALIEGQKMPDELSKQLEEVIGRDIPEAVGIINSGVSKMKSLLDNLLHLAKLGYSATEIVHLDMNAEIGDILNTMTFQVQQSGAEIKVEPLPSCLGDKSQINQVFSNLFANALNFLDPLRPGLVRITGRIEESYSVYCVQDNGIGIAADNIDNIFRMFYRIQSADYNGEGLGLAIVRRIVNRHNGEVWVESHYGKGSKFFVKLPRK